MSKITDSFDEITVSEELRKKIQKRINNDRKNRATIRDAETRTTKLSKKRRAFAIVFAVVFFVILILPVGFIAFLGIENARMNQKYDFSRAIPVKTESNLASLTMSKNKEYYSLTSFFTNFIKSVNSSVNEDTFFAEAQGSNSKTNVQVEGVDEGDLVKNDGEYIYRLTRNGFNIVRVNNGTVIEVSRIPIENFSPLEMYVRDKQVILVGGGYKTMPDNYKYDLISNGNRAYYYYHTNVEIRVYDISDITNPVESSYFQIEGTYHTTRISEKSGVMYFVVNYYNNYYYDNFENKEKEAKRPYIREDKNEIPQPLAIEDMYYFNRVPCSSYMIIGSIDLNDNKSEVRLKAYLGTPNVTYVSGEHIYIGTLQNYYTITGESDSTVTFIAKFSLANLEFIASNWVKGNIKNRYSMDEYDSNLRVASTYMERSNSLFDNSGTTFSSANAVYAFDKNMVKLSSITGIAKGEQIDSASFSEDNVYISTSVKMIDPLFIIDFSNIKKPTISEGLKEDGINNYLKSIIGTEFVIGLGMQSSSVKIQLYDMSGAEAVSVAKYVIGKYYSYSEALYNPKAILYLYNSETKKGIIGFSVEYADILNPDSYDYRLKNQQGFYLYTFDTELGSMEEVSFLSNLGDGIIFGDYDYYDYNEVCDIYSKYISRGIVIGDYIYTVSDSLITSYKLSEIIA